MFIETHAHLGDKAFDADRNAVAEKCFAAGVGLVIEIACAAADWAAADKLAAAYPGKIRTAFGLHPEYVKDAAPEHLAALPAWLGKSSCVALGEAGFDYWWEPGKKGEQLALLEAQLPLSGKFSKPVVFHARNGKAPGDDAYADLAACLKAKWDYSPARRFRGVLHCFSGTWEDAKAGLDLGLAIGVNGTFTYKNNGGLRETVKKAGLANLVLETDCPYLPPQSSRGKRNDPSFIPEIASALAAYLPAKLSEVAEAAEKNSRELFNLL